MKAILKITLLITLIVFICYSARVADCRQAMTIPADGKITVKDVGAYDHKENSREKLNGKEYIKINLSELSDICMNNDKGKAGGITWCAVQSSAKTNWIQRAGSGLFDWGYSAALCMPCR